MLIGERMSHPVIALQPNTTISDALNLFRRENPQGPGDQRWKFDRNCLNS